MSADHCRVKTLSVLAGTALLFSLSRGEVCRLATARERAASSDIGVRQYFGQRGDAHRGLHKSCMSQCGDTLFFGLRCQLMATGIVQNQMLQCRCNSVVTPSFSACAVSSWPLALCKIKCCNAAVIGMTWNKPIRPQ